MANNRYPVYKERTTVWAILTAIIIGGIGVLLLYFSSRDELWPNFNPWRGVLQQSGGLLLVTGAISLLWSLRGKRVFVDELLTKAKIAEEIRTAGIVGFTPSFQQNIDWRALFRTVHKLDIFFAYGRTWRNTHVEELKNLVVKNDSRIRVVLPDPNDAVTVSELARRFRSSEQEVTKSIQETGKYFRDINQGGKIKLWYLPSPPLFSFYRFDHTIVLAFYSHRKGRLPVPTIIVESGGKLYDFLYNEFGAMIKSDGLASPIF